MEALTVPAGFSEMRPYGPFHKLVGPMYCRKAEGHFFVGLRMEDRHCNGLGIGHGGVLLTLADTAMTFAVSGSVPRGSRTVTTTLSSDLIGAARSGDWIEAEAQVLRAGKRIVFLDCRIHRDGAQGSLLLRASATFAVSPPAA